MGQYYELVNENEKARVSPRITEDFVKLMEFSYVYNMFVLEILNKLKNEWYGNKVGLVGDYADEDEKYPVEEYPLLKANDPSWNTNRFFEGYTHEHWLGTAEKREAFVKDHVAVNLTKKEWIELTPQEETYDAWGISKLSLLIACGNQRGGGDYYGREAEKVGDWAFDEIGVVAKDDPILEGFTHKDFNPTEGGTTPVEVKDKSYGELTREEIIELMDAYSDYVQQCNDDGPDRLPVSLREYFDNDYKEDLE